MLYTQGMWIGLKNQLIACNVDATLIAVIPSTDQRQLVAELLNRDLAKINDWCKLMGMKLNPNKTQSIMVS